MKRISLFLLLLCACLGISAQTHMRIWQGGEDDHMKIANAGTMTINGGNITIKGNTYAMSSIDSIVIVPEITVQYNGTTATVNIPASVADDVTANVSGADVTITNNNVSNEVEIRLSGTSTNGSLTYNGLYKCTFYLDGLTLTSTKGCPLDIECGKRVSMVLTDGTTNALTDGASGDQKACLYCKGHLEIEGAGSLSITANAKHGISTKEYLQLKKSTGAITFVKAASDAIHAGQYFQMNGGTVTIDKNTLGDGIQVETSLTDDDKFDATEENNGQIIIKGGTIDATITGEDCKGIKCDSLVAISGGTITVHAKGNGSRGIQTDGNITIGDTDATTTITISAEGGKCTVDEDSDDPHKCMGVKADGTLTVIGGTTTVTATGSKAKAFKVGGYKYVSGTISPTPTVS